MPRSRSSPPPPNPERCSASTPLASSSPQAAGGPSCARSTPPISPPSPTRSTWPQRQPCPSPREPRCARFGRPGRPRGDGLAELGATEVVVGLDGISDPLDIVIDQVGGPQMAGAYSLLAPGGTLQSIGWASGQPATFPPGSSLGSPAPKSIVSVYNGAGLTDRRRQLTALLDLLAGGRLTVAIGWRGPWHRIADAVEALTARRLSGKAILDISQ